MRLIPDSPVHAPTSELTRKWTRLPSASFIRDALRRDLFAFRRAVALTVASGAALSLGASALRAQGNVQGDTQYQFQNAAGTFTTTTDPNTGAVTNQGFTPIFKDAAGTTDNTAGVNNQLLFGGTAAYTATDDIAAANVNNLTFTDTALVTLAPSATTNVLTLTTNSLGLGPSIYVGSGGATITTSLGGTAGFTKTGAGTLTLGTNASTLTGNVFVNAGTLVLTAGQSAAAVYNLASGTTLTTNQNSVAANNNVIFALSGTSTVNSNTGGTNGQNFYGQFAGNGNVNITFGAAGINNLSGGFLTNFGGTISFGSGSPSLRVTAVSSGTGATLASFATVDLGTASGSIFQRGGGNATYVLGGLTSTSATTSLNGPSVSGTGALTFVLGSANASTSFAGTLNGGTNGNPSYVKVGTGTLTLTDLGGTVFTSTGSYSANGGTLRLDYSNAPNGIMNTASALNFGGGTMTFQGKSTGATAQTVGSLTVNAGGGRLIVDTNGGASTTLTLGSIVSTAIGGSLNVRAINSGTTAGTATITTTSAPAADGTYGGRLTYTDSTGAVNWVTGTGAAAPFTLAPYSAYTTFAGTGDSATVNYVLNGSSTLAAADLANSLKITTGATGQSLNLGGNSLTLTNGGLLFTGPNDYAINNGTLLSANSTTTPDVILHQSGTNNLTVGAVIADNGALPTSLTKAGTGTLTLTGTNTFTGSTYVNNGVLSIGSATALGVPGATSTLNLSASTLQATGTFTLAGGAAATYFLLGGGGGTIDVTGSNNLTVSAVIGNLRANQFGPLIKTDTGTLTLTGTNTYAGATIISGGILSTPLLANGNAASGIGQAPATANALVLDGGTLQYTGAAVSTDRAFSLTPNGGTIDASGTGALTFTSISPVGFSGSGARALTLTGSTANTNVFAGAIGDGTGGSTSLVKGGSSTWQLTNSGHTYTGGTTVQGTGTLVLTAPFSANPIPNSNVITAGLATGSTAILDVTGLANGTLTLSANQTLAGTGKVTGGVSAPSLSILSPGSSTAPVGTLSITGGLTLGSGSITNIEFNTGTTGNDAVAVAGALSLNSTDGINLYQVGTLNKFTTAGTYTLFTYGTLSGTPASAFSVLNPATGLSYAFATGTGNTIRLTISGTATVTSTWNLNANGNYGTASNWTPATVPDGVGTTAVFGPVITAPRTVTIEAAHTVGEIDFNNANAYTLAGTSTLTLNNGASTAAIINDQNGSHFITAPLATSAAGVNVTVLNAANTLTIGGTVSGAGALNKLGAGTLALTGTNNSYSGGTTISNGAVQISGAGSLGASTGTVALNSAVNAVTLQPVNSFATPRNFTVAGASNTFLVDGTTSYEIDGVIADGASPGTLTKTGTGTLTLAGANTYMGINTISAGTLQLGAGGTTGSVVGNIAVAGSATLALNRSDALTFSNVISGAGSLSKLGANAVTLGVPNTFTGTTTISGGSLILGDPLALQSSTLSYNNQGGTLSFGALTTATLGGLSGAQTLDLDNTTPAAVALTVGGNGATSTYSGALTGAGSFAKLGVGTLTLSGANTYTGTTTVSAGVLSLTGSLGSTATPAAAVTVNGGNLTVNGGTLVAPSITETNPNGSSLTLTGNGTITLSGAYALNSSNSAQGGVASLLSGTFTANSITVGRTGLTNTALPAAGSTGDGIYVNGATLNVATTLSLGTNANTNSATNMRVDSGRVTVGGTTFITNNNGGRYSVLDVNGGTFTSNDTTGAGIVLGGTFAGTNGTLLVRGTGVLNANTITFGDAVQTSGNNTLNINGGTAYIGSGGLVNSTAGSTNVILLTAGALAASADWSTLVQIQLPTNNTGTIQSSDAMGVPHTISIGNYDPATSNINGQINNVTGVTTGGSFIVSGTGTVIVRSIGNYNGATVVNGGTLNIANDFNAGSIGTLLNTTALTINTGGTLLLSGDRTVNDRINNAATVTLNGGRLNTGGLSETANGSPGLGALTLQASSVIDLGTGAGSVLSFADSSLATWAGRLSVVNWSGNATTGGGIDQLLFVRGTDPATGTQGLTAAQLASIQFYADNGVTPLGSGAVLLSTGEVIPMVPEPTTNALILVAVVGAFGWSQRRRFARQAQLVGDQAKVA